MWKGWEKYWNCDLLFCFISELFPQSSQVYVFHITRANRNAELICMEQQPMFSSKIICNGLLNKGRVQLY